MTRSTAKSFSLVKTLSLTAAAFATVMIAGATVPGAVTSAEARSHGHHGHGHRHHGHHGHHRHHGHGHYFINSGSGGCYWMKERARDTGSRYWWNRYRSCIGD
jgi:hypothetical protein